MEAQGQTGDAGGGDRYRLLVVAAETLSGADLEQEIRAHAKGREPEVRVVFPAYTHSRLEHAMGAVDEGIAEAKGKLDREMEEARKRGLAIEGDIGDSDPLIAIEDALGAFPADEILIVTHPDDEAEWFERELFDHARRQFEPPLTHVVVEPNGEGTQVTETEHAGRGVDRGPDADIDTRSDNMPRWSARDLLGLIVALVGTLAAIVLAIDCPGRIEEGGGTSTACVIELILAGGIALINAAHVVALVLISGNQSDSPVERFAATFSLVGTPLVVVVNLLISLLAD